MNKDGSENKPGVSLKSKAAAAREERLKTALRANLQRRKGQSRVRKDDDQSKQS